MIWLKLMCLFFGIAYAVPVFGGLVDGRHVYAGQVVLFAAAWTGFAALQWFV